MSNKKLFLSWSITFDLECDEKMTEFLKRTHEEQMALNEAIKDRINKLFDKYIGCDSEETRNQPSRTGHIHLTSITLMVLGMLIGFLVKKAIL